MAGKLSDFGGKLSSIGGLLSSNGGRLSNFGGGAPEPITTEFSYAQFEKGLAGILDTTSSASRTYFGAQGKTVWTGYITGTEALLTVVRRTSTPATGMIVVSIDGATATNATYENSRFTLFTGLSDTQKKIIISVGAAYGSAAGVENSGNILSVTGAAPAITTADLTLNMFDGNAFTMSMAESKAAPYANYVPVLTTAGNQKYIASTRFKANATRLYVSSFSRYVYVSIDGAAPTRYDKGATAPIINAHIIDLTAGEHIYNVWTNDRGTGLNGLLSVGIVGTLSDVGTKRRIEQFGDSITEGVGATDRGEVDVMGIGSHFGMLGTSFGVAGETTAGLKARLPTLLTNITPTASDVAIIAIGRNDVLSWDATTDADYLDCINQLKAAYGTVLCRGILNAGAENWDTESANISAIVTTLADPNVHYIDVTGWTGITTADGTHPNDAGYDTIEAYAKTDYATYL